MDLWGGLISSEKTLIPMHNWMGGSDVLEDVSILVSVTGECEAYPFDFRMDADTFTLSR